MSTTVPEMVAASGALLDAVPIAILIHDHDGMPYYANRQARLLLTGNGDPWVPVGQVAAGVEIYAADTDIRYPLGRLPQVTTFSAGESRVGDMEIRRPGGTVHLEVWVKPTFSPDGALACVVHTFFDASERKNTDADLRLTESLSKSVAAEPGFADALETSLHEICQLTGWTFGQAWLPDDAGQHLQCRYAWHDDVAGLREFHEASRTTELALGDGLPGRVWLSQQWEWSGDATDDPAGPAFPSGHRASVAIPVLVAGEVVAVLEFFVLVGGSQDQRSLDRVGAVVSRVGLWMSTKGAEDAEDALEAQFRQIAESATDAIVSAGADNRIIYMNPSAERMFGYTADEVFGHSMTQLVHDRSDLEDGTDFGRYPQVGRGGLMGPAVYLAAVSKDGAEFPVEMNLTSWRQGNERFLTAIVRDASNRVDAEQRLEDALDREREVVEQLNVLDGLKYTVLQTLAHDLRNPIAAILALTAILRVYTDPEPASERTTPDGRVKLLSDIERSVRKMERLLEDLINSDPLQPIEARRTRCDVGALVSRVLAESDVGRNHPMHTDLQSVAVNVDAAQVERIVENLLNNADKHLDTGVAIWVTTTSPPEGGVLITVEDAGPGVSAAVRESIFEPFQRGDGRTSPGLGLGLSLVSRFAEIHGGRAWVEDRPGGGASFKVHLPDNDPVAKAASDPTALRILICDDDTIFGSALATLIGFTAGLELVAPPVMTGPEAIDGVARYAPDVVLMDVELLGAMDGFEATRLIRERSPATQVVVMSGASDLTRATANATKAGAASFLPKTEAVAKLFDSVRAAARRGPIGTELPTELTG